MKHHLAVFAIAGLMLAQMSSYNGGIPITPGTSVPESNPATAIAPPSYAPPSGAPAASPAIGSGSAASTAPSGPAYSFGSAPPPVVGPSH